MPVYRVSITVEAVVVAETDSEAQLEGYEALRSEIENLLFRDVSARRITKLSELPPGWSANSLVYPESVDNLTAAQVLAGGKVEVSP